MRKATARLAISEAEISLGRVMKELKELRERVELLEREAFRFGQDDILPTQKEPRLGRKPKFETEDLLDRRMRLSTWLEQNWPRLSVALRRAENSNNPSVAIAEFIAAKRYGIPACVSHRSATRQRIMLTLWGVFWRVGAFMGTQGLWRLQWPGCQSWVGRGRSIFARHTLTQLATHSRCTGTICGGSFLTG